MEFKFLTSSNIYDFPDTEYGREKIEDYLNEISRHINSEKIPDWTIIFFGVFTNSKHVKVLKRGITLTQSKTKEIFIHIPIPTQEDTSWGIDKERFRTSVATDDNKFIITPINFNHYSNLSELIIDCSCKGIKLALNAGITVNGQKIKTQ